MLNALKDHLSRLLIVEVPGQVRESDPLMHPNIQAMDLKQIADLPMWAGERRTYGSKHHHRTRSDRCRTPGAARPGRFSTMLVLAPILFGGFFATGPEAFAQSAEGMAAFSMPGDFGQWKPDAFVHNAYRFRQAEGNCVVTFIQNRGADAARASGKEPRHSLDAYIDGVNARVGRVTKVEMDSFELPSGADGKVPFVSAEIAYEGKDKMDYNNQVSAAWVGDVELIIVAACPAPQWLAGQKSIDDFVNKVTITQFRNP